MTQVVVAETSNDNFQGNKDFDDQVSEDKLSVISAI
jgi:hypothetical protein